MKESGVKETPLPFRAGMVRGILEDRKDTTRRLVKPQPRVVHALYDDATISTNLLFRRKDQRIRCPYGKPGDRLWVKETYVLEETGREYEARRPSDRPWQETEDGAVLVPHYRATDPEPHIVPWDAIDGEDDRTRWKSSLFMPKWVARIWLEVVSVGVERLQSITDIDAMAEGAEIGAYYSGATRMPTTYREAFEDLWNSIHGSGAWELNPWLWVIKFRRIKAPWEGK